MTKSRHLNRMKTFRGRTPTELAFGTSGLRGLVTDITDLEAYINTRGFLDYLFENNAVICGQEVFLGGDLRPSTNSPERSILRAVAKAVVDAPLTPVNLGPLPTPALTYQGLVQGRPSIMVTGSHIPFDRNGIKFNKPDGEVLKQDEKGILAAVAKIRATEYERGEQESLFDDAGWFKSGNHFEMPQESSAGTRNYLNRYLSALPPGCLKGLIVLFVQHSAVGRDLLPQLLSELGARVITAGRSETFVPVDTEALSTKMLEQFQGLADEAANSAGRLDAVVSTDGDSDRPLVLAPDEEGRLQFINGDLLGLLVASYLEADAIAVPISANDAIDRHFATSKVHITKTRIGSPHVIAAMKQLIHDGYRRVVGWEANGGFMTGLPMQLNGRELTALPTRDASLPIVAALQLINLKRRPLIDQVRALPKRFGAAGLIDQVPVATSRRMVEFLCPAPPQITSATFAEQTWSVVTDAGSTVPVGDELASLQLAADRTEQNFTEALGFGRLIGFNRLDGLRLFFANGDIAHLRPSGNAPQLRLYAVANSADRAQKILECGLAEPDGILPRLAHLLGSPGGDSSGDSIIRNVRMTREQIEQGLVPEVLGIVAGSESAQRFWQNVLDDARETFRARAAFAFHEDLPTNQAFGLLLLWQRLKPRLRSGECALVAFVFGDGTRSTPFTECESGQKPALATFVKSQQPRERYLSMVELAMQYFIPVQQYLKRSGFQGLVVKWGDEVQIPSLNLADRNDLFRQADIVRFVAVQEMTDDTARNKDWVGLDEKQKITAFIPRRPLAEMRQLAQRGLLREKAGKLYGGVNLGSIAISFALLDALLAEFSDLVNDSAANRKLRPALDPEFFAALVIAAMEDPKSRDEAWANACAESPDFQRMTENLPNIRTQLTSALDRFSNANHRPVRIVAMDFQSQYWGDIGQHAKIHEFYTDLLRDSDNGRIARAMAGLPERTLESGSIILNSEISPDVKVKNSVIIDARLIGSGTVENSVLIQTTAQDIEAHNAFDVQSTAPELCLPDRGGAYKVVSNEPVRLVAGQRATTLFLPDTKEALFRIDESADLKGKNGSYTIPVADNPLSFEQAHQIMSRVNAHDLNKRREEARNQVTNQMSVPTG